MLNVFLEIAKYCIVVSAILVIAV